MNNEQYSGRTINDLMTLADAGLKVSDGTFNVEEFRKSLEASPKLAKVLQFPKPVVEVSPSQVVELEESPMQRMMRGVFLGGE